MSRTNITVPLFGAAAVLGGGLYYARKPSSTTTSSSSSSSSSDASQKISDADKVAQKKSRADARRDLGMGGAGVGANHMTGGTELGSGLTSGNTENPNRDAPKGPTDKMPSDAGAVGGGHGGGNANTRAVETHGSSSSSGGGRAGGGGGGGEGGGSGGGGGGGGGITHGQRLQGFFGVGGSKEGERPRQAPVDTKIASNHSETPTKRGGSPFDKHRRDVTAVSPTES